MRFKFVIGFVVLLCLGTARHAAALEDGELTGPFRPSFEGKGGESVNMVVYVNGVNTNDESAESVARSLAERLQRPTYLLFNDLTLPVVDWFSTLVEKLGDADTSINASTEILDGLIVRELDAGREITLIGHSAGALVINNAVRSIAERYSALPADARAQRLARIHVVCMGGAVFGDENVFADGWPDGLGSLYDVRDERDGVANVWGSGCCWNWFDCEVDEDYHAAIRYVDYLDRAMLTQSGAMIVGS